MASRSTLHPLLRSDGRPRSGLLVLVAVLLLALDAAPAFARVKIGVTPGSLADSVHVAAAEAKEQGLDVEVVEFTDWTTPNLALANGDLDVNYFQHQAFLDNAVKENRLCAEERRRRHPAQDRSVLREAASSPPCRTGPRWRWRTIR